VQRKQSARAGMEANEDDKRLPGMRPGCGHELRFSWEGCLIAWYPRSSRRVCLIISNRELLDAHERMKNGHVFLNGTIMTINIDLVSLSCLP
jgi:hypothetical protein